MKNETSNIEEAILIIYRMTGDVSDEVSAHSTMKKEAH